LVLRTLSFEGFMIIVRSPLRISFAGGGTDLRAYYQDHPGAVCSMAINKYVYVTINNLSTFFPHRFRIAYSQTELTQDVSSIKHPIVKAALKMLPAFRGGIDISVMSDVPAGTGLGSSSTFTVSLLHALCAFQNKLTSKEELARNACQIEIDHLKEPIGKQDQYAAAFGGINLFHFNSNEQVEVQPIPLSSEAKQTLLDRLLLFYLGNNRQASEILKTHTANIPNKQSELLEMKEQALQVAQILTQPNDPNDYDELGKLLKRGWMLKKSLAPEVTNSEVDQAMEHALESGAIGGKLLGAGKTGFLLLYVPPNKKTAVRNALSIYKEVFFQPDELGSTLLYYTN